MSLADLIARRDAAARDYDRAQAEYQRTLSGAAWRALEAARVARREASDACDKASAAVTPEQVASVRAVLTRKPQTVDEIRTAVAMSLAETVDALTVLRRARKLRRMYDAARAGYTYVATGAP